MERQKLPRIICAEDSASTALVHSAGLGDGLLECALYYVRELGWSVIPIISGKRPPKGFRLKPRFKRSASVEEVQQWFSTYKPTGIGVVCGEVSGNLAVRDFDNPTAYERWTARFPEVSRRTPTAQTVRGYHVYITTSSLKSREYSDGEYRGEGYFVLAPPSRHPSGGAYRWLVKPVPGEIPFIADPGEVGLLGDGTEPTEPTEPIEPTESTDAIGEVFEGTGEIIQVIRATLPKGPGHRNKCLFKLARRLKAIPGLQDASPSQLAGILRMWHQMVLPKIHTKSFDETRLDFHRAWQRVIWPAGVDAMGASLKAADLKGIPPEAEHYDNSNVCRLAGLCRELQLLAGDSVFFLSCRTVARLFGVGVNTAYRWLLMLEMDGLLDVKERGSRKTMKATRFRYVGAQKSK